MTRDEFVEDGLYDAEHSFNADRPQSRRFPHKKPKERKRLAKGLGLGFDLREAGKAPVEIAIKLKQEMFGSIWMVLIQFIWSQWGDDIIAWIIGRLFPVAMGAAPAEVWIVGRYIMDVHGGIAWEFQGAFADKDKAVAACRDRNYFIGPATVDEERPHETEQWDGAYYPLAT